MSSIISFSKDLYPGVETAKKCPCYRIGIHTLSSVSLSSTSQSSVSVSSCMWNKEDALARLSESVTPLCDTGSAADGKHMRLAGFHLSQRKHVSAFILLQSESVCLIDLLTKQTDRPTRQLGFYWHARSKVYNLQVKGYQDKAGTKCC